MGSYIYLPSGALVADIDALAAPASDRLLFAGEATSRDGNGYVHGAILSGIREAERVLDRQGQGVELESGLVIELGCDEEA
jgi:monoamine oxidase